ncbi:MAG: class I SAM-dependent RNA methyltransferase [Burkholderiales bacterium]|nr:class I SAM-dependent RNA methyltransferase [Burkholderiales bacterium]
MNQLQLFLPCAAGVEGYLADEAERVIGVRGQTGRAGLMLSASWRDAMKLNLHTRLAQRVLVQLAHEPYRSEADLYDAAASVAWEIWFTPRQSFKIEITAQHSPLQSLNFAALKVKDAVADRFRHKTGVRPDVDTARPDVRIFVHLTTDHVSLYIDTSGEPLFKRGWREDKGDAPLKETLAAAMLAAAGWARRFGFERLLPYQSHVWQGIKNEAEDTVLTSGEGQKRFKDGDAPFIFGSDVSHRMVDFAQRNAERAGVAHVIEFRGGDALQRMPPCERPGVMLLNPPYGERIAAAGVAGERAADRAGERMGARGNDRFDTRLDARFDPRGPRGPQGAGFDRPAPRVHRVGANADRPLMSPQGMGREQAQTDEGGSDFFPRLASHWKKNFSGWTAWMLTPDLKLPSQMRLKESRRVPMWNGPIECRLFRFDLIAGSARGPRTADAAAGQPASPDATTATPRGPQA